MNHVLLTGATGFIGRHFLNYLTRQGITVRILVRDPIKATLFSPTIQMHQGDLTDQKSLAHSCDDIDTVFHLAGFAHAFAEGNALFAKKHYAVNYLGTKHLLMEASHAGVKKFIYFSSVKAVSDSEDCIDEQWDQPAHSPYGLAKREAEKLVLAKGRNMNMHVSVLRPALVYGPGWKGNLASMLRLIDKGFFLPFPETHNRRSLVSVEDICHAAYLAAHQPIANGKIYFVTDGVYYSTHQLYVLMCEALGKRVPSWSLPRIVLRLLATIGDGIGKIVGKRMPFNSEAVAKLFESAQYNSCLIQKELGFKPKYDLKTVLPSIITVYRSN